ncbi:MAG: hypothetical protein K9N35_04065 [Candidatus Marinimicrobia bacterium]|nr:hypothetical protein [Candidatus Neomarinimicrobiota bacterium]
MNIRGNYILLFIVQFLSGFWTYYACVQFGIMGVIYGFIPFAIALIAVQTKYLPDERELALIHKTDSVQGIVIAILMAVVYLWFPELNWFYIFIANISIVRGAIGTALFLIS